jgi:hypothetical protein
MIVLLDQSHQKQYFILLKIHIFMMQSARRYINYSTVPLWFEVGRSGIGHCFWKKSMYLTIQEYAITEPKDSPFLQ